MLDGAIKSIMVDDSQIVSNMMVIICTKIGITNHDEYSLVREKTEDEENQTPNKKYGTLGTIGGTLTLKKNKHKNPDSDEPQVDPKMATLRKNLHTEDGGERERLSYLRNLRPSSEMSSHRKPGRLPFFLSICAASLGRRRRFSVLPSGLRRSDCGPETGDGPAVAGRSGFNVGRNLVILQLTGWTMARHCANRALTRRRFCSSGGNISTAMLTWTPGNFIRNITISLLLSFH